MAKAHDAFRTISEVSETLDTPTHVLRFWESKFSQIKPVKRAGGRRYYRPDDMALLAGIKDLLHEQGMTIKGAQKLLRERGVKHVVAMGHDILEGRAPARDDAQMIDVTPVQPEPVVEVADADVSDTTPDVVAAPDAPAPTVTTLFTAPSAASLETPEPAPVEEPASYSAPPAELIDASAESEVQEEDITAQPDPVNMPPMAAAIAVPPIPEPKSMPSRMFGALRQADHDKVRAKASEIAPLIARLESVRDAMRHS